MSDLKKVYVARGLGDAHVLCGILESNDIRAVLRGDEFMPLQGVGLFCPETRPSVWVLEDEDFPQAFKIAREYSGCSRQERQSASQDEEKSEEVWVCLSCGEEIEKQFSDCWKCGSGRP
jgi:hypothetical protein